MYNCLLCGQCSNSRYCIQAVPQQLGYPVLDYDEEWQYTCDAVGEHSDAPITVNASGYIGILAVGVHGYNTFHYCTCRSHNSSTLQVSNSQVTFVTMSVSCRQCLLWGGVSQSPTPSFPLLIVVLSGIQHPFMHSIPRSSQLPSSKAVLCHTRALHQPRRSKVKHGQR